VNIGRYGIIDLRVSSDDELEIVVEVKVAAPESEKRLQMYRDWLRTRAAAKGFLFSLVRHPAQDFPCQKYGVTRKTWRQLYEYLRHLTGKITWEEDSTRLG